MAFGKKPELSKYEVNSGQNYDPKQHEISSKGKNYREKQSDQEEQADQEKQSDEEKPLDQENPFDQIKQQFQQKTSVYAEKTNVLASISLIMVFIFWPAALILSIIALIQINNNPEKKGKGLAIAALVISLMYLAFTIIFARNLITDVLKLF